MGAFCIIFQARPVGMGLGAKFGRKPAKNQIRLMLLIRSPTPASESSDLLRPFDNVFGVRGHRFGPSSGFRRVVWFGGTDGTKPYVFYSLCMVVYVAALWMAIKF